MLEIRPCCEHCGKDLPNTATDAMICSFECTYCEECATTVFENVCPNCGGGFQKRPVRPQAYIEKYPPSEKKVFKPKDIESLQEHINKYREIPPEKR
ncbi:DUF1272 domain-containing protein [Leptobacterium flavescens]|uniref:DUF1272 domain-containing protein n=2 Tax=Leptobacterium flavescens TaxID=472055 RepID=A0A6P0UNX8_9FLAO|nr:DUF1272 domain-containing protein [Leptobacterium flavescens]